jgi:methionyl-tRNA formyltransferase
MARIGVAATAPFGADVLERLAARHDVAFVLTRPDAPAGRGRKVAPPAAKAAAERLGLRVLQPERPEIEAADAIVVAAYGLLIPESLLDRALWLKVHPSLLPRWRGAAPVERAIIAGDVETGVSIMRVTAGLDSGPVCLAEAEPIRPDDDYASLSARLQELGARLLVRALDERPPCVEQDEAGVTYAEKIGPQDRWLDPEQPVDPLERRVRALTPHIGAYVELDGDTRLGVTRAALAAGIDDVPPGELTERDGRLLYGAVQGALELIEVQPPGKKPMEAAAWLRGRR